jgi:hypothetical protein
LRLAKASDMTGVNFMRALSRRLSDNAEAVCRAYLPGGRRSGRYWIAGDVSGARGRSLFVRIAGDGSGKWTDAATGDYGDLLDLIRLNKGFNSSRETIDEARSFLRDPRPVRSFPVSERARHRDTSAAARKLFASARPVAGTLAETYLRGRGIIASLDWPSLRFHPGCYYRPDDENAPSEIRPALLAAVTALDGTLTGLQRTWLASDDSGKAPVAEPRRAMGRILGNAVRFGKPDSVMAAGEGIETVLSLLSLFPSLPMVAALSATHLAAQLLPPSLRRLYVLRDNDAAGEFAEERLHERCREAGIDCRALLPAANDLNVDLCAVPPDAVKRRMLAQMAVADRKRFSG